MRTNVARIPLIFVIGVTAMLSGGPEMQAHDGGCDVDLRAAPIEAMAPPPGWVWRSLEVGPDGWDGHLEWAGGDIREASLSLWCVDDAEGLWSRRAEVREALGIEHIAVESDVGAAAAAWRALPAGGLRLEWRSGDVIGVLSGEHNATLGEMVAIAAGIDATLALDPVAAP